MHTLRVLSSLVLLSLAACAAGSDDGVIRGSGGSSGGGSGGSAGSSGGGGSSGSAGGPVFDAAPPDDSGGAGCATGADLIYVISKSEELWSFDPAANSLSKVGAIACPQNGGTATPFSMAVDRQAIAWVLFNDGNLYRVDTRTAACTATTFQPGQSGYTTFGMGFVTDAAGSTDETLWIANDTAIAKLDTTTLKVTPASGTFGFSAAAELTGTGDARLFGFFYGFPPYIAPIDRTTSALGAEMNLDDVDAGTGFAFAFWGGDFWIFTAPNGSTSQINRFTPTAGNTTTTVVVQDAGFKIVGAGVSTCAPLVAPK